MSSSLRESVDVHILAFTAQRQVAILQQPTQVARTATTMHDDQHGAAAQRSALIRRLSRANQVVKSSQAVQDTDLLQHRSPTIRTSNLRTNAEGGAQGHALKSPRCSRSSHALAVYGEILWLLVSGWGASGLHLHLDARKTRFPFSRVDGMTSCLRAFLSSFRCGRGGGGGGRARESEVFAGGEELQLGAEEGGSAGRRRKGENGERECEEKEGWTERSVRGSTSTTKTSAASTSVASDARPASPWGTSSASGSRVQRGAVLLSTVQE
ncbi:hypothetical protein K438DRAFT_1939864 [Mycena galopus ATCC 62051]|nr:hypothetical protein K438DRAFT_1939864 [Mycena galopus ATCC 62051]